jgi:hypothetical protein
VDWSNASFGYHIYVETNVDNVNSAITQIQSLNVPQMMTEYCVNNVNTCSAFNDPQFMENEFCPWNISWAYLNGVGFSDADNGQNYGDPSTATDPPVHITWPADCSPSLLLEGGRRSLGHIFDTAAVDIEFLCTQALERECSTLYVCGQEIIWRLATLQQRPSS